jgi:hypothetical protein
MTAPVAGQRAGSAAEPQANLHLRIFPIDILTGSAPLAP